MIEYALVSMLLTAGIVATFLGLMMLIFSLLGISIKPEKAKEPMTQYGVEIPNTNYQFGNSIGQSIEKNDKPAPMLLFFITIVILVISISIFLYIFIRLSNRFVIYTEKISEGIHKISEGDFNYKIDVNRRDEFGKIAENLNQMSDKLKQIMEKEHQDEIEKRNLITNVAHDLRTPLTSMIGYLELVKTKKLDTEEQKKYIEIAYRKSKGLEKLIEDLFAYTKYVSNDMKIKKTKLNLSKFLNQLLEEYYLNFEENHLELVTQGLDGNVMIIADPDLLVRAFTNLLGNALKYGRNGKVIRVELVEREDYVLVRMTNYGELVPKEELENIFKRFYRVEGSRSEKTGGTGLGLAIAKTIIELHQGTIHAISDYDGTTFTIKLNKSEESDYEDEKK